MGSAVEREEFGRSLATVLHDHADAVGIQNVDVQGIFDGVTQVAAVDTVPAVAARE